MHTRNPPHPVEAAARPIMKTLARGADFAAAPIMPQATLTEERVLRAGGNAFDAIVAGQAVSGVVQPSANGIGSDAVLLVYDAKAGRVSSINAEGTAWPPSNGTKTITAASSR